MNDEDKKAWCIKTFEGAFLPYVARASWGNADRLDFELSLPPTKLEIPAYFRLAPIFKRVHLKDEILKLRASLQDQGIALNEWQAPFVEEEQG